MKNRNYLILGTLIAVVLGIIFIGLTTENSMVPRDYFSDLGSVFFLLFCLSLFYIMAFSDFNQASSLRLTKYRLRWLMDMSIYLGFMHIFIQSVSTWSIQWVKGPDWTTETENFILFYGNNLRELFSFLGLMQSSEIVPFENIAPIAGMGAGMGILLTKLLYSLLLCFSFYLMSFFIKDNSGGDSIKPGRRVYVNTIAFIMIMGAIFDSVSINVVVFGVSVFVFLNQYVLLFLFGVLLFYYFQPGSSLSMLIKNLFCDCDEAADSIKAQLGAIFKAKRLIMCLCCIAVMFIPTAIFGGLTFHTEDSYGIFRLLQNATLLMFWGFLLIVMLTALEGKYNYKLFHQNGSLITDNMFLPKFVALPVILYFLLVIVLFILFNVLF